MLPRDHPANRDWGDESVMRSAAPEVAALTQLPLDIYMTQVVVVSQMEEIMETGLLWYDASNASIDVKIEAAAKRYAERFSKRPTTCFAHPNTVGQSPKKVGAISVKTSPCILPNHFWIGVEK